jgi:Na+/H+ antiporter NhaD/arsenite permease-like protein
VFRILAENQNSMFVLMAVLFILGYALIALEHPLKVSKSATAILLAVGLWALLILSRTDPGETNRELLGHLGGIAEILFFLLGAMTIVELVDSHEGFRIITDRIQTVNRVKLLWIISLITFFLSAVLDNLTTAIVMVALLRKLISDKRDRWFFAGMVIIAANSGGAFSPIGDVTTIMLWIGGQVTTLNIIVKTFIPSLVSTVLPLAVLSFLMKGHVTRPANSEKRSLHDPTTSFERNLVFFTGIASLLFVPVFKTITHLPPYTGILLGLGVLWVMTEILHRSKHEDHKPRLTVAGVLQRVDTSTILFFLGILLAVAALESAGHLALLADTLDERIGNLYVINIFIGFLSAIVDNVPLVAGAIGMYGTTYPADHYFWEMLAYCAGTGGSILVIGSAAGVAVMGMEKIDFIWYLKKIAPWALFGYLAGAAVYWGMTV